MISITFAKNIDIMAQRRYRGITEDRTKWVQQQYERLRRTGSYPTVLAICREIYHLPAPCYYISYECAKIVLWRRRRTGSTQIRFEECARLYDAFLYEFDRIQGAYPTMSEREIYFRVSEKKAPSCGLSLNKIISIIVEYREAKRRNKQQQHTL